MDFMFPSLTNKQQAVTYTAFQENLQKGLKDAGVSKLTLHSFQKGFMTHAVDKGIQIARIKPFGRWKMDSSFERYVDNAEDWKLKIGQDMMNYP